MGSIYTNREPERQMSEAGSHHPCPGYFGGRKPDAEADIAHRIGVSRQTIQKVKKDFETAANAFWRRSTK
jgi:hypothetical protein